MRVGLVVVVCVVLGLAGCSGGVLSGVSSGGTQAASVAGARLTGVVHGGQQPLVGAHVYLLAAASGAAGSGNGAGAAAYGGAGIAASATNASVSLMTTGTLDASGGATNGFYYVTTDGSGNFAITGDYSCMAGQQVYLYVTGGDPGVGSGVNPAAGLMAALGNCPGTAGSTGNTFSSGLYIVVNEVSTVAAAYAMAGFATDATHVGSSGSALALTGIANAFANAGNLETLGTGVALAVTAAGNGTVPQAEIYSLANVLASCVNSAGPGSAGCSTLFANAKSGGSTGTVAADTATAAINIAHNPGANVAALWGLVGGAPAFAGGLTAAPNDWTVGLKFAGGNQPNALGIAVDGAGNVWMVNGSLFSVLEVSPLGAFLSGSLGYHAGMDPHFPVGVSIDFSGNAWVTDNGSNSVTEVSSSGTFLSPVGGYTGGGLFGPGGIAIDGSNNVWVTNAYIVSEFSNAGLSLAGTGGYTGGGLNGAAGVAVAADGSVWIANQTGNSALKFSNSWTPLSGAGGFTGGGLSQPFAIAIDSAGSAWLANSGGGVVKLSSTGSILSGSSGYTTGTNTTGGMTGLTGIAIDGAGNAWVANYSGHTIVEFSNSGVSLLSGIDTSTVGSSPMGIAVDGSGDVWTKANGAALEILGVATPVVTPLAVGVKNNALGTRP